MFDLAPIVLILLVAILAVVLCRKMKAPPMLGYLMAGFLTGPGLLKLFPEHQANHILGEIGIAFLMFSIGLEFSLPALKAMRRLVFGLGLAQVTACLMCIGLAAYILSGGHFLTAFIIGSALALSSTAIVSKLLTERLELNQPHGQAAIGVLLFQDIAVVPLLILLPSLAKNSDTLWLDIGGALLKIIIVMTLILFVGQKIMRPWFHTIARQQSSELFSINVLFITLGIGWLTEHWGLSLSLGAFLAGMLISETEYRYQVEEEIKPFRDILLGLFFVTVGMKIQWQIMEQYLGSIFIMLFLLLAIKLLVIFLLGKFFGLRSNHALKTALALAQGGEFGFVILALGSQLKAINAEMEQSALAALVLSMLIAPFLIQHAEKIVKIFIKDDWMFQSLDLHKILVQSMSTHDHVLICGYGKRGQSIARLLEQEHIPSFALDLDPDLVREASEAGDSVVFGDAARHDVLTAAGIQRARVVVLTFSDVHACSKIIQSIRAIRKDIPIISRAHDDAHADILHTHGAHKVLAEGFETTLMLGVKVLETLQIPKTHIDERLNMIRNERYESFKKFFRSNQDELKSIDCSVPRLYSIVLNQHAYAVGHTLEQIIQDLHIDIQYLRRSGVRYNHPDLSIVLQEGDTLVVFGEPHKVHRAEQYLLDGSL
jgi:CPA2 family monovalent cation:H+ antiporter-2